MNRYPLWKYLVILVALAIGFLYTLPNFFGEAPAVQVSSGKATVRVDLATQKQVEDLLAAANLKPNGVFFDMTAPRAACACALPTPTRSSRPRMRWRAA